MGRFVSIFFIVALGVAFYSGIRASEPSMRITADQYFDDSELMDLKVMGTMGLTKADIKAIGKVSGIEAVEGGYSNKWRGLDRWKEYCKVFAEAAYFL